MDKIRSNLSESFWASKKVLITGHTGFVGCWLNYLLLKSNADTYGLSLKDKNKEKNFFDLLYFNKKKSFFFNITDFNKLDKLVKKIKPNIIIHLAAQPLVLYSYLNPLETYKTNITGTINVLRILKKYKFLQTGLFFTTDKVYENKLKKKAFKEIDKLNGEDPYSGSKAASEIIINSFTKSFLKNKNILVLRAGNIVGGGDFNKSRLIPDIVLNSIKKKILYIRNKNSIRPWQHILDVIFIIKHLIKKTYSKKNYEIFNLGPNKSSINVDKILKKFEKSFLIKKKFSRPTNKEKKSLILDTTKIKQKYNLKNILTSNEIFERTISWYEKYHKQKIDLKKLMDDDFKFFIKKKNYE